MHEWRKILRMARKRIYREPKQQMGVSIHSDLADMTAALALAAYMENRRLLEEVRAA